ncbi:AAA family ATPase [Porphyrobacter algicida]|uniref:AAA family ATPase n=1 Tax=Qipengyuania algicida TaxID=1836209 RepID=A0A845APJ7_9SPHN|nr:AAA family ATPase [Qipengyuania algicida]
MSTLSSEIIDVKFDQRASVLAMMKWFAAQDFSVLPIHGVVDGCCTCGNHECVSVGKHPISSLVPHGVKDATTSLKTIRRWHRKHPDMNYAVATEGLAVIDCDSKEALKAFRSSHHPPPTLTVKTERGFHFYFLGEMPARNAARSKLDVKSGPGCYVVGPSSVHASGTIYMLWEDEPIARLPSSIASITAHREEPLTTGESGPIPVGLRNSTMTQFAGYMHGKGVPQPAVLETLKTLNRTMSETPLPDREVRQIARSVARYPVKAPPRIVPFSEIPEEQLEFLWYPYICLGTLGLLDGDPGDGKSQLGVWLCSRLSRGDRLPNGDRFPPSNCFLFNFEDLPGAVIKKRLEANGADLSRVFIQSRQFQLTSEMVEWMDGEIAEKRPRLVILDPIQAFMSGVDGNSNIDVREFMARLAEIAMNRKCAIICVRHFGKGAQDKAMKKGLGSTDFVGISRNQFGLARRDDGVRGFIVFHMKTNFERGQSMLFTMGDADGRKGEQPVIGFEKFTDISADDFFSGEASTRGPDQDEREVAKAYLLEVLAAGPKAAAILKSKAEARAISASTLDRARKELGIITAKEGKIWFWSLPPD